jgi:dipeptidyl aminopeptidase/acylaminoacyl peptidase
MYGFEWMHHIQAIAAQGYAVFYTNPRGSSGYGNDFLRAVDKEWGGKVYTDIMSGVDAVLLQNSWIDSSRLGVLGASFGGFMTNWVISHTTRFAAAVPMASISDLISIEGTRDDFYDHAHDFGGDLFQNAELYWKYSPVHFAKNVKTPTLILHGEADQRVPLEQPEQWFRALRHFNVPAEFVIFPREGHAGLVSGEPKHVVGAMRWVSYWFDKYLNHNSAATPPDALKLKPMAAKLPAATLQ